MIRCIDLPLLITIILQNSTAPGLVTQISFSSVDYTVEGEDAEIMPSPDQISVILAPSSKEEQRIGTGDFKRDAETEPTLGYCFALYDYDSETADELNLEEGQVCKSLYKYKLLQQ